MAGYRQLARSIAEGKFDAASDEEKARAVRELIRACSVAAGLVALQPVPFLDISLLTPIHVAMIEGIAHLHGYRLDKKSAFELLRAWRASLLAQQATMAASKLVPGFGWAISAATAQAFTYALGELADRYFRSGRTMLPREVRTTIRRLYKEGLQRVVSANRAVNASRPQA